MKKLLILIISLALVLASSCSHNAKTPAKPADPATPADTTVLTVKELLQNFPVTFEEYIEALENNSGRSASRSAAGEPLTENDLQGFSSNAYDQMGDGAASILAFLAVLRNDITNIEGINLTEAYTLPNTFSVSQKTITEVSNKWGFSADAFDEVDFGTLKVTFDEKNVTIYWSFIIRSCPFYMLVKGVQNEDGIYDEITTYAYQNFGIVYDCMVHYFQKDNQYLETVDMKSDDSRTRFISFEENNSFDYYCFDSDDAKNFVYKNAQYYADYQYYSSSDTEEYCIYDENGEIIAYKEDPDELYYVPLKFINTNGKTITKQTDGTTQYFIDDVLTENIVPKIFPQLDNNSSNHIAYKLSDANLAADGFTYTKAQTFASATQKINSMKQTYNSSDFMNNFISDTEFNQLKQDCVNWVSSL